MWFIESKKQIFVAHALQDCAREVEPKISASCLLQAIIAAFPRWLRADNPTSSLSLILMALTVYSLAADKPKILFYAAMMVIQNFGFFSMYYDIYYMVPLSDPCEGLRFWVGVFAIDCFIESFCVLWMAMGGYIDDGCMFTFGWFLHLFVALPYCICTYTIPTAMYSDAGIECTDSMGSVGATLQVTYWTHAACFLVYVRRIRNHTRLCRLRYATPPQLTSRVFGARCIAGVDDAVDHLLLLPQADLCHQAAAAAVMVPTCTLGSDREGKA